LLIGTMLKWWTKSNSSMRTQSNGGFPSQGEFILTLTLIYIFFLALLSSVWAMNLTIKVYLVVPMSRHWTISWKDTPSHSVTKFMRDHSVSVHELLMYAFNLQNWHLFDNIKLSLFSYMPFLFCALLL
jgi:hypothetical protein